MQANSITFNDSELHSVLINHTRYCLGRRSYAVGECADLLKSKWLQIPLNTQTIIRRDIEDAIRDDNQIIKMAEERRISNPDDDGYFFPMDKCDRSTWDDVLAFIDRHKIPTSDRISIYKIGD
jgi:hypothetical protein